MGQMKAFAYSPIGFLQLKQSWREILFCWPFFQIISMLPTCFKPLQIQMPQSNDAISYSIARTKNY
jgi:hypothetical protein